MGISIRDKDIDKKLEEQQKYLKDQFGIRASKTDVIRYLLKMKKQGNKTKKKWPIL